MTKTKGCSCKEGCQSRNALYEIHCHQCGKFLAAVPMSTWTRCPDCRRWSRVEPGGGEENQQKAGKAKSRSGGK